MATEGVSDVVVCAGMDGKHDLTNAVDIYRSVLKRLSTKIHRFLLSEASSMDIIAFLA